MRSVTVNLEKVKRLFPIDKIRNKMGKQKKEQAYSKHK